MEMRGRARGRGEIGIVPGRSLRDQVFTPSR